MNAIASDYLASQISDKSFEVSDTIARPFSTYGLRKSGVYRLRCDNSKIDRLTDYKLQVDLRKGYQKTIDCIAHPTNLRAHKAELNNV